MGLTVAVARLFDLIIFILFVTICLSWVPSINWRKEPFFFLKRFSEIFLSPFRKLIPPIGMLDISPVVLFICLSIARNVIVGALDSLGL